MSDKNKKSGIIFAAWTVGALIVLIAFLVNGNKIISNLKTTDFFERVFGTGTTPEFVKNHKEEKPKSNGLLEVEVEGELVQKQETNEIPATTPQQNPNFQGNGNLNDSNSNSSSNPSMNELKSNQAQDSIAQSGAETKNDASQTNQSEQNQTVSSATEQKSEEKNSSVAVPPAAPKPINLKVCFVIIDSDGSITRKEAVRSTTKRDAPLTAAIELLLSGPTIQERNSNYMTLIPSGTKLINAYIKNGVAVLNFSEAFEYNSYGVEGYLGQLMQIVYTATSFSTVESVQFLIEGQKKDYLGSEGVWIGSPLARSSFK